MHEIQKKLVALARITDLSELSYRQVGSRIGVEHPNTVSHHLKQLYKKGVLVKNAQGNTLAVGDEQQTQNMLNIPIMGRANCGHATEFATDDIKGYLKVSPSTVKTKQLDKIFALQAVGNSMTQADIGNLGIENGDYVLVKQAQWGDISDGDYIVSVIEGMANIKKIFVDVENHRILLNSESNEPLPPIIIAAEDLSWYNINGRVVEVIKGTGSLPDGANSV